MLKGVFLSVLSGVLLALTVYPVHWKFLCWVALVPFLLAIEKEKSWKAFSFGLIPPLIYVPILCYWIAYYRAWIFFVVLPIYVLSFALFSACVNRLVRKWPQAGVRFWIPPVLWLTMEFLFSLTPLGSMATHLETIQTQGMLQILSVSGEAPMVFLFLFVNSIVAYGLLKREKVSWPFLVLTLLAALGVELYGKVQLQSVREGEIKVAVAQPNFPLGEEWRHLHVDEIFKTYEEMALEASGKGAQVVVFPQYTIPVDVYVEPERIAAIARKAKTTLLLGTYTPPDNSTGRYNIALVFSPEGKIIGEHRAVRPPPFRHIGQIRAKRISVIETPFGKWGILLCYEDTDPKVARELVNQGAEILFSLLNDVHFKRTKGLYYHFTRSILRATETRRYVVRSATTGISAIVDPYGRVVAQTPMAGKALIFGTVSRLGGKTFFVEKGDLLTPFCAFVTLGLLMFSIFPLSSPKARKL
jgi:apolipoprotein N-acyltransferase